MASTEYLSLTKQEASYVLKHSKKHIYNIQMASRWSTEMASYTEIIKNTHETEKIYIPKYYLKSIWKVFFITPKSKMH